MENFNNKKILVTGGTGSIGSTIARRLLQLGASQIRIFSRDETKQHHLKQELGHDERVRFLIGDIRNKDRVNKAMENIDIVFHTAAMKHVVACENDPFEAVETNIKGMQNIIDCAMANDVSKVINISTDKATDPVSVMGCTKLLAEKMMLAHYCGSHPTKFCSVRFGNVLGSRGSVIPLFYEQIKNGGPITLTGKDIYRFFMSVDQAVNLVFKAADFMQDREIFIFKKMSIVSIYNLAQAMIELHAPKFGLNPDNINIKIIGLRKGERKHEKLLTSDESEYSIETEDMYIITPVINFGINAPTIIADYSNATKSKLGDYSTENKESLSVEGIKQLLLREKIN